MTATPELRTGMLFDEDINAYHASEAVSHSKLNFFAENFPLTYKHKYIDKCLEPEGPKEHYDIGHAVEALLCGQKEFDALVSVSPYPDFKTKEARQWRDWSRAAGIIPLSADNNALVHRMYDAVMRNPDAVALLAAGTPQVTFRSKVRNVYMQCRCDWYGPSGTVLPGDGMETGPYDCDLKTCDSLHPSAFIGFDKHALQLNYHHAAVWYAMQIRRVLAEIAGEPEATLPFVKRFFIVVDKKEWPSCTVYTLPEILFEVAYQALFADDPPGTVKRIMACFESGVWPDAPVRKEIANPITEGAREFLKLEEDVPVILILGGSQGAQKINDAVLGGLKELVEKYAVIHQAGERNIAEVSATGEAVLFGSSHKDRYKPYDYLNPLALRMAAGVASVVISRAGSTIFEIAAWRVPAIIIPINERVSRDQRSNAFAYARSGACEVIEEGNLTPNILVSELERLVNNEETRQKMKEAARSFYKPDAARLVAEEILKIALEHEVEK